MPEIDVTDILRDKFVAATRFKFLRRRQVVDNFGIMNVPKAIVMYGVGSITPTGDNSLTRQDAFQTQANTIRVITQTRLYGQQKVYISGSTDYYQPDLILWNGNAYIVRDVNDYTPFGAGFLRCDCSSIEFNDLPPFEFPGAHFAFSVPGNSGLVPTVGCKCF